LTLKAALPREKICCPIREQPPSTVVSISLDIQSCRAPGEGICSDQHQTIFDLEIATLSRSHSRASNLLGRNDGS
jgi:hypothetical protein